MGFSGHLVFARSRGPLSEEPVFAALGQRTEGRVDAWWPRPGGWQTLQVVQGLWEDDFLPVLAGSTGAPVCVADVSDSSVALVTGLGTDGRRWQAWLNLDVAAGMLTERPDDVDDDSLWAATPACDEAVERTLAELQEDVPADAEGALVWATAAGVRRPGERSRIEELLGARETFVEDLFSDLLDELGSPRAVEPSPES
ncbi:hypothetical protein ACFVU3_11005 [Streptomyces sp. NPDC058052]|uniref:hypothetical protein n=1 Tax=Streptomyces sp. NPDC058052 TaxID=3346316 RepID=UPI0036E59779